MQSINLRSSIQYKQSFRQIYLSTQASQMHRKNQQCNEENMYPGNELYNQDESHYIQKCLPLNGTIQFKKKNTLNRQSLN